MPHRVRTEMTGNLGGDIRRMFRSVHWIGGVALKTTLMLAGIGIVLLVGGLWLPAAVVLALAPLVLLGWFASSVGRRIVARSPKAEENHRQDWQWFRDAGPVLRAGAITVMVLAVLTVVILNYLQRKWELPPYGP